MLNPVEEEVIGDLAIMRGEVVEVNDGVEEEVADTDKEPEMEISEVIRLCEQMERISIKYGSPETSLDLSRRIRRLRIEVRRMEGAMLKQSTIDRWVKGAGASQ